MSYKFYSIILSSKFILTILIFECLHVSSDKSCRSSPNGISTEYSCKIDSDEETILETLDEEEKDLENLEIERVITDALKILELNDPERNMSKNEKLQRRKRQQERENIFVFTDDIKDFTDLFNGGGKHDKKLFHKEAPEGYAHSDRTKLLLFNPRDANYPPFTYRGKDNWHKIPIQSLMKKRNRSFMLLEHRCEQNDIRLSEKECIKKEYESLPSCSDFQQSPINIVKEKADQGTNTEFIYENLMDEGGENPIPFDFVMSLPWDGTDILTVELKPEAGKGLPSMSDGSMKTTGTLERIHIHFGENETVGSEHTIDGLVYSMEIQLVFTNKQNNEDQYWDLLMRYYATTGSNDGMKNREKSVQIIAFWVRVVDDETFKTADAEWNDDWNRKAAKEFETLSLAARKLWAIHNQLNPDTNSQNNAKSSSKGFKYRGVKSSGVDGAKLRLGSFFPPRVRDPPKIGPYRDSIYYDYLGAITHPPCFGYVWWAVYDRPLHIPKSVWQNFLYIGSEFDDTQFLAGNYRLPNDTYVRGLDIKLNTKEEMMETSNKIEKRRVRKSIPKVLFESSIEDTSSAYLLLPYSILFHMLDLTLVFIFFFHY